MEIKIIRDIKLGEKLKENPAEGESAIEYEFVARAGTIIGKDEDGVVFTELKDGKKKQLAPVKPELAEEVWKKAQEQLPEVEEQERIDGIKEELSKMIIGNCRKAQLWKMEEQLKFMKENPNTVLPTELDYATTVEVFERAISKFKFNLLKRKKKLDAEKGVK